MLRYQLWRVNSAHLLTYVGKTTVQYFLNSDVLTDNRSCVVIGCAATRLCRLKAAKNAELFSIHGVRPDRM